MAIQIRNEPAQHIGVVNSAPCIGAIKDPVYTATPSTLATVLKNADPGAIVNLSAGEYSLLNLKGNESYPENLTIIGEEGVNIAGITITSGVRPEDGIDKELVVMPKGLTLKNLTFTDKLNIINSDISDLSVINCHFDAKAFINCRANAFDAGGTRKGANETMAHNILVKGCTFDGSSTREYGIYLEAVDGAVFEDNTIDRATVHGILVSSIYVNDNWSCGKFIVRNNTVSNTIFEGIKFWFLKDASLYIQNNTLTSSSEIKGILANNCASTTISADGNVLNGEALAIKESHVSSPADYIKNQIGLAAALKEKADKTDLDSKMDKGVMLYYHPYDTDETGLNEWLENTVLPTMPNNTCKNVAIRCDAINQVLMSGVVYKNTNEWVTVDLVSHVYGWHYTKTKNTDWGSTIDKQWRNTVCHDSVFSTGEMDATTCSFSKNCKFYIVEVYIDVGDSTGRYYHTFAVDAYTLQYAPYRIFDFVIPFNSSSVSIGGCRLTLNAIKGAVFTVEAIGESLDVRITRIVGYN